MMETTGLYFCVGRTKNENSESFYVTADTFDEAVEKAKLYVNVVESVSLQGGYFKG